MTCYHPLAAIRIADKNGNVNVKVLGAVEKFLGYDKFKSKVAHTHVKSGIDVEPLLLSCGNCIGCRLERSRNWAVRCIHEASLHDQNCFLTLTYDDGHLPQDHSLHKDHFQKFMKRLRKAVPFIKIRYFACGEYGSNLKTSRPHYHAIIFGWRPSDQKLFSIKHGSKLYVSPMLAKVWPFGFHTIGDVTFESAAYVARYVLKKVNGKQSDLYYDGLEKEFVLMSRRPGIAYDWIKKYHEDVYPNDFVVIRDNIKCRPPRYYDKIYDEVLNGDLDYLKNKRKDSINDKSWSDLQRIEKCITTKFKNKEGKFNRRIEDI